MKSTLWLFVPLLLLVPTNQASAFYLRFRPLLKKTNSQIQGHVVDYTSNHGKDNRLYSKALGCKRDMYVYLPPHFDLKKKYPLLIWLHGFAQDEVSFLQYVVQPLDQAIAKGDFPPIIIAAPDGSFRGRACFYEAGSFYLNTKAGNFEDYLMKDVWCFLHRTFPIRPEREAHAIAGGSMGGCAAYNKAIKYRHLIKNVVGIYPPLNNRWISARGRYADNFSPDNWGWRTDFNRHFEVIGRFYLVLTFRLGSIVKPLYGRSQGTTEQVSRENPIEMIDRLHLRPKEIDMFVAYGGKDEFNLDAQIESFLYLARKRGLHVDVVYDPKGRHDWSTAKKFIPDILHWLAVRLGPYSPGNCEHP